MKLRGAALRYHGGKWRLAPWIISHFPPHRTYTEVFGGSAAVLLHKPESYSEVYNDLYDDIVAFFKVLRDPEHSVKLKELLELTPFARTEFLACGKRSKNEIEQARRLIVRSFQGYGSDSVFGRVTGFRDDSNKSGSTPAKDWVRYPERILALSHRLRGVVIECRPAIQVLRKHDGPNTLHYVDPPYVHLTRSQGNPYCKKHLYAHEMTDDQHRELSKVLHELEGMVVVSGYPSDLYSELFGGWKCVTKNTHADGAAKRIEALWLNPAVVERIQPALIDSNGGGNGWI